MFDLELYLKDHAALVETALAEFLPQEGELAESMRYTTLGGGKRIRGVLLLAAAEYIGYAALETLLPAAASLECIHAYSLIHDDLPCMDDDEIRRGKPTNHKVYGEALALLAGDGLLTFAFELMAKVKRPPEDVVAAISDLAQAAGPSGMVEGQVFDLAEKEEVTLEELEAINLRKTAALITTALSCGARLAGAEKEDLEALIIYGTKLGLAFQIVDDLLDLEGDPEKLGKAIGADARQGKTTYPMLMGQKEAKAYAQKTIIEAKEALDPGRGEALFAIADYVITRQW